MAVGTRQMGPFHRFGRGRDVRRHRFSPTHRPRATHPVRMRLAMLPAQAARKHRMVLALD